MEVTLKQAGELIEKANKIVLSSHVNPDGDNVGSTFRAISCPKRELIKI